MYKMHYIINCHKVNDQRQRNERECPLREGEEKPVKSTYSQVNGTTYIYVYKYMNWCIYVYVYIYIYKYIHIYRVNPRLTPNPICEEVVHEVDNQRQRNERECPLGEGELEPEKRERVRSHNYYKQMYI